VKHLDEALGNLVEVFMYEMKHPTTEQ